MEQVSMRVVLRFAGMRPGALCVMECGQNLAHKWPADSWDTQQSVMNVHATVAYLRQDLAGQGLCQTFKVPALVNFGG